MLSFLFRSYPILHNALTVPSFKTYLAFAPSYHLISGVVTQRLYTRGAERLFHRVDWERAVGLVVVVDPFDSASLLYLPPAGYIDLIKTALANRSPLVVVHGLNDEVPQVTEEVSGTGPDTVKYRVYSVNGKTVHKVPSQNSPQFGHSATTLRVGQKDKPSSPLLKGSRGSSWASSPEGRSTFETLKVLTWILARRSNKCDTRPRSWLSFVPSSLLSQDEAYNKWPGEITSRSRRPILSGKKGEVTVGRIEALLLHRFCWVGATLLARTARSLQWSFTMLGTFMTLWQSNGLKTAAMHFAEGRRILQKFISGEIVKTSCIAGVPVGLDRGLPTILPRGLRRYIIGGHVQAIRLAFFMLNVCDALKWVANPKLENITRPYEGTMSLTSGLQEEMASAVKLLTTLGTGSPRLGGWHGYHATVKAGPYGRAMLSAPMDAAALYVHEVWDSFQTMCLITPNAKELLSRTEWLAKVTNWFMRPFWQGSLSRLTVGKLSTITEPRGKVRTIAIPGYQIQCILRPLHDMLFSFLKGLPTDHTFDQEAGVQRAIDSAQQNMCSYDLSAATDRFPIWFQEEVLRLLLRRQLGDSKSVLYAKAWGALLSGLDFAFRLTPKGRLHILKYAAGQPMGCYSSWAAFTASHHVVVQLAAHRVGFEIPYTNYDLLGDDILVRGDEPIDALVRQAYLDIMGGLGVSISPSKGVESSNGTFEFAKRFVRGREVLSSLRWKELTSCSDWKGVFGVLLSMTRRGLPLPQLRTALDAGYVLSTGRPYSKDLGQMKKVNLWAERALRNAIILLIGPLGPYKVPLVAWLSGRGTFHVDFHPNLGHFINNVNRVVMGYDVQFPIAIGINSVREELARRVLAIQTSAYGLLKVLYKQIPGVPGRALPLHLRGRTVITVHPKPKISFRPYKGKALRQLYKTYVDVWPNQGLFYELSSTSVTEGFRRLNFLTLESLEKLFELAGTLLSKADYLVRDKPTTHINSDFTEVLVEPGKALSDVSRRPLLRYRVNIEAGEFLLSDDLMIGLLRTIVAVSPARLVNIRTAMDLLGPKSIHHALEIDPDNPWVFGSSYGALQIDDLKNKVGKLTESVLPPKYQHPSQLLQECRECITDFLKISVADILPSVMPAHMDLMEVQVNAQASAILKAYKALKDDPMYKSGTIMIPEGTDVSQPPGYTLELTNGVRLDTNDSALKPRYEVGAIVRRRLADASGYPVVYQPLQEYKVQFANIARVTAKELDLARQRGDYADAHFVMMG